MSAVAKRAEGTENWRSDIPAALKSAVQEYVQRDADWFQPLADLSGRTEFDSLDVDTDVILLENGKWIAPATAFVTLVYHDNDNDLRLPDAFPATVRFSVDDESVTIDAIDVDVSSFYQ
jgi:hypothetical protein